MKKRISSLLAMMALALFLCVPALAAGFDEAKLAELIELYRRVLGGAVENPENLPGTTRGHYFRGVM